MLARQDLLLDVSLPFDELLILAQEAHEDGAPARSRCFSAKTLLGLIFLECPHYREAAPH